jgi:hypothetical protein
MYVYSYESNFQDKIELYDFHIFKPNELKVIHDLYNPNVCLKHCQKRLPSQRKRHTWDTPSLDSFLPPSTN